MDEVKEILAALGKERREVFCGALREEYVRDVLRVNNNNMMNVTGNNNKQFVIIPT